MTAENLGAIAGVVLSLIFSYIPGVSGWFGSLTSGNKQAIMGVLLIIVAAGAYALSCAGVSATFACTKDGAIAGLNILIAALVANQGTYLLTKK